jgi:hypothetical protein
MGRSLQKERLKQVMPARVGLTPTSPRAGTGGALSAAQPASGLDCKIRSSRPAAKALREFSAAVSDAVALV